MANDLCFICKDVLSAKVTNLVARGLPALLKASLERKDENYELLKNLDSIEVHSSCRKYYTSRKNDKLSNPNLGKRACTSKSALFSPSKSKIRKSKESFDFYNDCFICGKEANQLKENRKSYVYRKIICDVTDEQFQKDLTVLIKKKNDPVAKDVQRRISCVNLLAKKARYHKACMKSFEYIPLNTTKTEPLDNNFEKEMEVVYNYIDDSEEPFFHYRELKGLLGKKLFSYLKKLRF